MEKLNLNRASRLPMVLQTEAAECGLACLSMILAYHGHHADLMHLRRRYSMSLRGASLKDLIRVADQTGLAARPVRIDLQELKSLNTPCILHWDINHFVVLKGFHRHKVIIHDPGVGVRKMPLSEVSRHFTGVAMELTPIASFEPVQAAPSIRLHSLIGHMVGLKRALWQLFLLAFAMELFAVVSPLFMQWVIDHALITADRNLLLTLALGFSLLLIIRTAVSAMRGWLLIATGASLNVQGHSNLFSHLLRLPAAYFETRHLGDVMSRFGSQNTILHAITTNVVEAVLDGILAILTLVVMLIYAPMLALVVVAGAFLYGLLRWASYTPLRQASAEAIVWAAKRDSHFLETLRGIKAIKLFNGQDERRGHWLNLLVEALNRQLITQKLSLLYNTGNSLLKGSLAILVVWLGAQSILNNTFSIGMLFAFIAYKDQFLQRVSTLIDRVLELHMLSLHAERLADIALTPPEPTDFTIQPDNGAERAPVAIQVRNLNFRYSENDPWVLDGLTFDIRAGESVAIIGSSGCGKTTLLKLLASLLQPTEGEILVDNKPLAQIGMAQYRSMLGVVMQNDDLFTGSIADNISFFSERPELTRIEECAKQAAIHDDIAAMPMGYSTLIGDMGSVLSGGQKQRVLIARALYRQPSILLLDEATSHLDVDREKDVNAAIGMSGMTRIIIAHRPETIRSADRIITLRQGKLVSEQRECLPDRDSTISHGNAERRAPEKAANENRQGDIIPRQDEAYLKSRSRVNTGDTILSMSSKPVQTPDTLQHKRLRVAIACEPEPLRQDLVRILTASGIEVVSNGPLEKQYLHRLALHDIDILLVELDEEAEHRVSNLYESLTNWGCPVLFNEYNITEQQLQQGDLKFGHNLALKLASMMQFSPDCRRKHLINPS